MWSDWLIFCDCGFHSVCLLMNKAYGSFLMGETDWGGNCLVLMGGAMLSTVHFNSVSQLCPTLCDPMDSRPSCPSPTPELTQTHVHWVSDAIQPSLLCFPLLLSPSVFTSIMVFSNKSALRIRWPKYWSFSFNFSPSSEYSGPISFRMDWFDFLAVQGTLKSLLSPHSSRASIL